MTSYLLQAQFIVIASCTMINWPEMEQSRMQIHANFTLPKWERAKQIELAGLSLEQWWFQLEHCEYLHDATWLPLESLPTRSLSDNK